MPSHKYVFLRILLVTTLLPTLFSASAQVSFNKSDSLIKASGLTHNSRFFSAVNNDRSSAFPQHYTSTATNLVETAPPLFQDPDAGFANIEERKQLMVYLKQATVNENTAYTQAKIKRLYHLARFFTRLRMYPLAMKCFFKTMALNKTEDADTTHNLSQRTDSTVNYVDAGYLDVDAKDDSVVEKQGDILKPLNDKPQKSDPIGYAQITNTFNDGKKAIAYAMIFHVKQPVRGKRKVYLLANTGHTFITLIKYNTDSSYASLSFGFYPKKDNVLSATPIIPLTSSVFKNDSNHDWDEILGKFISKRRFEKVLQLTKEYSNIQYHLCKNNCTDFGLKAALLAGLNLWDTNGSWPLGHGNNPGVTGQSIIYGEFKNADTGNGDHLLVDFYPPVK